MTASVLRQRAVTSAGRRCGAGRGGGKEQRIIVRIFRAADSLPAADPVVDPAAGPAVADPRLEAVLGDVAPGTVDGAAVPASVGADIVRLQAYFEAIRDDLGARLLAAEAQIRDLRVRVAELERFRGPADAAAATIGASTARHDEYRAIASRVEGLLDQQITYLATRGGRATPDAARLARRLADVLFTGPAPDVETVRDGLRQLVADAVVDPTMPAGGGVVDAGAVETETAAAVAAVTAGAEIGRLRDAAVQGGLPHQWTFEAALGGPLDESRQRTFGLCDPDHRVDLVVFPALVVDGVIMMRQRVHTAARVTPVRTG
ncbi:hypothetical protein [Frankia sp. R82]|uniref:hypothetical protein n=1 Tax=Frankia sp. R82 TaxID=2950553 RepID=UPI002042D7B2|nr:hypothetical protein [Frankia sp. R82]MCM3882810.1 hypothetical protein [Frankia sp. R82]